MTINVVGWNPDEVLNPRDPIARQIATGLRSEDALRFDSYAECRTQIDALLRSGERTIELAGAWGEECVAGLAAYALAKGAQVIIYMDYVLSHEGYYPVDAMVRAVGIWLTSMERVQAPFEYSYHEASHTLHLSIRTSKD